MAVEAVGKSFTVPLTGPATAPENTESVGKGSAGSSDRVQSRGTPDRKQADGAVNVPGQDGFDRMKLDDLMDKLNIVMNTLDIQARFSVHEATKEIMVKVVNVQSGKVIREIPPQRVLDMVAKMQDMVGLLMDERG